MEEEVENGVRKRSQTPVSWKQQRKPPSTLPAPPPPPPPPRVPRWLILDRIVHRSSRRRHGVIQDDATASALAHDCVGRPVRASLRIADPPAVSRLYLHLTGRPPIEGFSEPTVIAAHRSSILFYMATPFEDPLMWSRAPFFPDDYFVYSSSCFSSSSLSSSPPTLTLLPPCFHGGNTNPTKLDDFLQPYRNQQQRTMLDQDVGILCHGDDHQGEFTVAHLTFDENNEFELCVLHHRRPPPAASAGISTTEWSLKKVQKSPPHMKKISIYSWMTDVVVPIGSRCLCWVDYYQGMLLVDVLTDSDSSSDSDDPDHQQSLLRFIPLPKKALKSRRPYRDAGSPDPFRCVSVTDDGIVKLVCILTKRPPSPYPFTITTWTLDDDKLEGKWAMDVNVTMGAEEFFSLLGTAGHSSCLPMVQPSFPVVSLVDPDVICFLLKDKERGLFWIVEVDMRNKKLQSSALYISEEEEDGYPPKRGRRNNFYGHYFIPSKFTSYLSEDAITSRELSEMMQKSKQSRVMQRSGLEAQLKWCS